MKSKHLHQFQTPSLSRFKDIRAAGVEKAGSTEALLEPRTEMVKEKRKAMHRYCLSPHISVI
jgi:hypothetical protein